MKRVLSALFFVGYGLMNHDNESAGEDSLWERRTGRGAKQELRVSIGE